MGSVQAPFNARMNRLFGTYALGRGHPARTGARRRSVLLRGGPVAALLGWIAATAVFCAAIAAGPLWPLVPLIAAALAYKIL